MKPFAPFFRLACAALLTPVFLVGCGGSDNGGLFVTSMVASTVQFSRNMSVAVSGSGLDKGLKLTVEGGCGEVTEAAGGDSQSRRFSCKVTALGPKTVRAYTADNLEVARLQVTVPEPEVTMIVQGVDTSTSTFVMKLDPVRAPVTVNNFLDYVNAGFYRLTIFHRVVKDFVVQGGGFTAGTAAPVVKNPTQPAIALEVSPALRNVKGSVAMARTSDPNSATSQFYINTVDNPSLDVGSTENPAGYAVFGSVISGLDVIERMSAVPVRFVNFGLTHVPVTNVIIISALQTK